MRKPEHLTILVLGEVIGKKFHIYLHQTFDTDFRYFKFHALFSDHQTDKNKEPMVPYLKEKKLGHK